MSVPIQVGYRATRDAKGILTVHDVPIFCECERGETSFDAAWIEAAVEKALAAESEGYLPPLHVRHHGAGSGDVAAAGYFRITRAAPIKFKGSDRMAIYADLIVTSPDVSMDVLAKRLPYRSVEIYRVDDPAIDSLALLDHEAPYLELPMLMVQHLADTQHQPSVASATFSNPWLSGAASADDRVVACFRRGSTAHLFTEDLMTQTIKAAKADKRKPIATASNVNFAAEYEDEGKDKGEDKGEAEDKGEEMMGCEAIVKAIKDGSISVADMMAIMEAIQEQQSGAADTEKSGGGLPAPAAAPGESMSKQNLDLEMARVAGENAALKSRLDERDAADKRRSDVGTAMARLSGRALGSDLEGKLSEFHSKFGAAAFAVHVDAIATTFGRVPGDAGGDAAAFASQSAPAPREALAYQELGVEAVVQATTFAREHDALAQHGIARVPVARYLEINMARKGFTLAKKA